MAENTWTLNVEVSQQFVLFQYLKSSWELGQSISTVLYVVGLIIYSVVEL